MKQTKEQRERSQRAHAMAFAAWGQKGRRQTMRFTLHDSTPQIIRGMVEKASGAKTGRCVRTLADGRKLVASRFTDRGRMRVTIGALHPGDEGLKDGTNANACVYHFMEKEVNA